MDIHAIFIVIGSLATAGHPAWLYESRHAYRAAAWAAACKYQQIISAATQPQDIHEALERRNQLACGTGRPSRWLNDNHATDIRITDEYGCIVVVGADVDGGGWKQLPQGANQRRRQDQVSQFAPRHDQDAGRCFSVSCLRARHGVIMVADPSEDKYLFFNRLPAYRRDVGGVRN